MLLMDIDKFKNYNDTYGHQQGDAALKAFAKVASETLLRAVDFAARWGGEEFVILLPGTGVKGAVEIAEKVRKNIENTIIPTEDGDITKVTVSIGISSMVPETDSSVKEYIECADKALYKAKESGRNRYVVSDESDMSEGDA